MKKRSFSKMHNTIHTEPVQGPNFASWVPPTHPLHPDHEILLPKFSVQKTEQELNFAPMIMEWDDDNKKQVEDAKKVYQQARREHREITDMDDKSIEFFHPSLLGFKIKGKALKDGEFSMRILNEKGDETLIWNSNDPDQVRESAKLFKEYVEKGWTAYAISADGSMKRKVTVFNAELLEVTFEEIGSGKTIKEKLSSFVKSFKQVQMQPKTYPG
jgi:hypothetical protein